jgi:hypothetical protein
MREGYELVSPCSVERLVEGRDLREEGSVE